MTYFDMQGQKVNNQYNAGRDINFGNVQTTDDLIIELEMLQSEFLKAKGNNTISEDIAVDAEYQVTKALQQAKKPDPDKRTLLDHLNSARTLIEDIAAAGGLVTALAGAIQAVQRLFS